jgi:chaperone modulatory protein CbpM
MTADPTAPGEPANARFASFILEDQIGLTFDELCRACALQSELMVELIDEGVLTPDVEAPAGALSPATGDWRFTGLHIHRARMAVRLQRDLGVNLAGAALALELLEEVDALKAQLRQLSGG